MWNRKVTKSVCTRLEKNQMSRVLLFTQPGCLSCELMKIFLEAKGITFEERDIVANPEPPISHPSPPLRGNFFTGSPAFVWGVSRALGRAVFTGKLLLSGEAQHP